MHELVYPTYPSPPYESFQIFTWNIAKWCLKQHKISLKTIYYLQSYQFHQFSYSSWNFATFLAIISTFSTSSWLLKVWNIQSWYKKLFAGYFDIYLDVKKTGETCDQTINVWPPYQQDWKFVHDCGHNSHCPRELLP